MIAYTPNDRYGRLTPMAVFEQPGKFYARLLCLCECGKLKAFYKDNLVRGFTNSCGCFRSELIPHSATAMFGGTSDRNHPLYSTYRAWTAMKLRCHNPKDQEYADYGGRGIIVCDRWRNSFPNFLDDMGQRPQGRHGKGVAFSIDRYPNKNGNYEPGNCRWATWVEQNNNRRPAKTNRWKKLREAHCGN